MERDYARTAWQLEGLRHAFGGRGGAAPLHLVLHDGHVEMAEEHVQRVLLAEQTSALWHFDRQPWAATVMGLGELLPSSDATRPRTSTR